MALGHPPLLFYVLRCGLLAALMVLLSSACSLTLELESCAGNDECDEGFICSEDRLCVDSSAQCQIDADCTELFGSGGSCDDGVCQGETALTGGPCQRLEGAVGDENPFLLGVILQTSGVGGGFGQPMLVSMRLAMNDINGIGGINGRRIGLVVCDTQGSNQRAREAAQHLIDNVGVPAILGLNSSQVIELGPSLIAANDVLLMSPSATASTISGLSNSELIWRTAPSDEAQAIALSGLVSHLIDEVLPAQGIAEPKVAILVRRLDRWAEGLNDDLLLSLPTEILNGGSDRFTTYNFANVGAGEAPDYTGTASHLATEAVAPDLVIVLGSADSWQLIDHIDTLLENEPLFIGGDAMKNAQEAAGADPSLENRIWGTGPRNVAETGYEPYLIFRLKFQREFNDEPNNYQFVANAFDALYTLAFAASAEGFTGPELAQGLTRLGDGVDIDPTASDAQQAIEILSGQDSINYRGASGPINFDERGDPEPMPIALWCFRNGTVPERGELYSPQTGFTALTCLEDSLDSNSQEN